MDMTCDVLTPAQCPQPASPLSAGGFPGSCVRRSTAASVPLATPSLCPATSTMRIPALQHAADIPAIDSKLLFALPFHLPPSLAPAPVHGWELPHAQLQVNSPRAYLGLYGIPARHGDAEQGRLSDEAESRGSRVCGEQCNNMQGLHVAPFPRPAGRAPPSPDRCNTQEGASVRIIAPHIVSPQALASAACQPPHFAPVNVSFHRLNAK